MIIIARKYGQLGNRLILFAHVIAFGIEHDLVVSNAAMAEYADYFEVMRRDVFCRYPVRRSRIPATRLVRRVYYGRVLWFVQSPLQRWLPARLHLHVALPEIHTPFSLDDAANARKLQTPLLTTLSGWLFRGSDNVEKHALAIRAYFAPIEKHRRNVMALIQRARQTCDVLVGIHIRRGDYELHFPGRFFAVEEYLAIMRKLEGLFQGRRVGFLVCSDEQQDARTYEGFTATFGTGHLVEDLYSFAACDYLVGPRSTYTGWASFYGRVPLLWIASPAAEISLQEFFVNDRLV